MSILDNLKQAEEKAQKALEDAAANVKKATADHAHATTEWMKAAKAHLEAKLRDELSKSGGK
jgi:hypothetical protein